MITTSIIFWWIFGYLLLGLVLSIIAIWALLKQLTDL